MVRVELFAEAADVLDALIDAGDPMAERIEDALDVIATDPFDARVRRRMLSGPKRFIYIVFGRQGELDWMILWHIERSPEPVIVIDYLGQSIF